MFLKAKILTEKFRRLLYLSTPNETSFETIGDVPQYVDEALPYFAGLIVLESVVLFVQGKSLPRLNDAFSSLSAGVLSLLHGLVFRSVELACYVWMFENFSVITLPWQSPWTWLAAFVGVDFTYYWVHRCGHEVNFIWSGHQAHHSSEDYNLTTALRQSAILRYFTWMFYLPMALFIPPSMFLVHNQFNLLYQFWIHTEVIGQLGVLEYIINTPSHHRVHHGRNPYCIDKNYGGTLIVWDRLFGTFQKERKCEQVVYGLVHPLSSWEPLYVQFCHLIHIMRTAKHMSGIKNKISVIVKGPGWLPGKPRLGNKTDIPQISFPVLKYNSCLPWWASLYVWIHFTLVSLGYIIVAAYKQNIAGLYRVLYIVFTITSMSTFGLLYDNRKWAVLMEMCRCAVVTVVVYVLGFELSYYVADALCIVHLISLALWGCVTFVQCVKITRKKLS